MADVWPTTKIKSKIAAQRILDKISRSIALTESCHRQYDRDKKRLAEALQWALEEISRLEEDNRSYQLRQGEMKL